jgi:hypothetical protein
MALDIQGFVTPEQSFKGLTDVGEIFAKKKAAAAKAAEAAAANKEVMNKALLSMADPKDYLSGSPYDPNVVEGFNKIYKHGMELMETPGMTTSMLYAGLAPEVENVTKYATIAKVSKKGLDEGITKYGDNAGYDKAALYNQAINSVFFHEDGTPKEMNEIDLSVNPYEDVIQKHPELVTTNKGVDEWLKGEPVNTQTIKTKTRDKSGIVRSADTEITAPSWSQLETKDGVHTGKFIPQYELATESNQPIKHVWTDESGKKHEDEVRILPDDTYKRIMANSRATNDFVRGQVKLHLNEYESATGQKLDMNSPQAETLAKAILYKELEGRSPGKYKDATVSMQPITNINVRTGGGADGDAMVKDVFKLIDKSVTVGQQRKDAGEFGKEKIGKKYIQPLNELPPNAQNTLLNIINQNIPIQENKYGQGDVYIARNSQGVLEARSKKEENKDALIMPFDYTSINIAAKQPSKKEQQQVIATGKKKEMEVIKPGKQSKSNKDPLGIF